MEDLAERLEQIIAGDPDAQTWLYETFAPKLFRKLRNRYRATRLDPEELLHDAFVSFYQHEARVLRTFLDRTAAADRTLQTLDLYLWDLACGVATNRRRSAQARRTETLPVHEPTAEVDAEQQASSREALQRLYDCLRGSKQRVVIYFLLRYVEGLTPEEVAEVTGWSRKATYKLRRDMSEALDACARRLGLR